MHHKVDGVIQPKDFNEPIVPWLDVAYMEEQVPDYRDQQVFSFLGSGVQYLADMPYQIVPIPHLQSLRHGCRPICDEMEKQLERDWYSFYYDFQRNPPCIPYCLTVRGAAPRASEAQAGS